MTTTELVRKGPPSPALYMLVGLPCTGKTTILRQKFIENHASIVTASTDDFIESYAETQGISYNEAFANIVGAATHDMHERVKEAIKRDASVVWDQTNLTAKQRRKKMNLFPSHYLKYAIVSLEKDPVVLHERMKDKRPSKVIPLKVLEDMAARFEMPTKKEEDFDAIFLTDGTQVE